ncbi:leucyl/phenylalanyl-tRNA--protein transferase [Stagnimonas aquatica]|uniref:Leucyl/phenylalanyl-tRNA--protein transferase n=1 Tax=Stagnimonas aquatica TaxID=2689987 RepID=A0A3N0V5B0_9GAMM|nr:leucyl/phenylalanyl-tRNA--protein transferase [Stagnimonas aquatica]ROH87903.1 leucyl/phenylalanyl-tRNA--protein transferase [Stagnimonas aquatica]
MTAQSPVRLQWLDPRQPDQPFPPVESALPEPNGLLAVGGDLSVQRLLRAYALGVFPWFNPDEPILWWSPDPRCIFIPGELHLSHSLSKRLRQNRHALSFDLAFDEVLEACASERRGSRGTWLGPDMRRAYRELHRLGHAHSVELWMDGELAGGLYGVSLRGAFFGESMFSRRSDASKLALAHLSRQLKAWDFSLLDCQVSSDHLLSLGARSVSREEFLHRLHAALQQPAPRQWRFEPALAGNPAHLPPALELRP